MDKVKIVLKSIYQHKGIYSFNKTKKYKGITNVQDIEREIIF